MRRLCRRRRCWRAGCKERENIKAEVAENTEFAERRAKRRKEERLGQNPPLRNLTMLSYEQARNKIIEQVGKRRGPRETAVVSVWDALGLVLAQEVKTD